MVTERNFDNCQRLMALMSKICKELGVPVADEKTAEAAEKLTFLGIALDSIAQTLSLPVGKYSKIQRL